MTSYKINLLIEPNWPQIVRWYFPKLKNDKAAREFMSELRNKYKTDPERSLYLKQFSFTEFYDGLSGLNLIWSDQFKRFSTDLDVNGWLLTDSTGKLEDELISKGADGNERSFALIISPHSITAADGEIISTIPYDDIINLFVQIQKETGLARYEVRKFPENFQTIFEENNISYEADFHIYTPRRSDPELIDRRSQWFKGSGIRLSTQTVESHMFKTPYYSVWFKIKFFEADGMRPNTTDLSKL